MVGNFRSSGAGGAGLLDLGCAGGELAEELGELGHGYLGIDASADMIHRARRRYPDRCFRIGDARQSGLSSSSFDAVVALGLLEYMEEPDGLLSEVGRLLRPGGDLFLSVPSRYCFENWIKALLFFPRRVLASYYFHFTGRQPYRIRHLAFSPVRLRALLHRHGFEIRELTRYNPNPLCFPLSRAVPGLSVRTSQRLEDRADSFPWKFFATAFLLRARLVPGAGPLSRSFEKTKSDP